MRRYLVPVMALLLTSSLVAWKSAGNEEPTDVSMISLIATPERYEGKLVRVRGYMHLEFEGDGLYLHRDDEKYALYNNGVWVGPFTSPPPKNANNKYVLIEGRFSGKDKGHMGLWSGAIRDVTRCDPR